MTTDTPPRRARSQRRYLIPGEPPPLRGRRSQQIKCLLKLIDAGEEEMNSNIENQSHRASVSTKLVRPFGSQLVCTSKYNVSPFDHCPATHLNHNGIGALGGNIDLLNLQGWRFKRICNVCGRERHRAEHAHLRFILQVFSWFTTLAAEILRHHAEYALQCIPFQLFLVYNVCGRERHRAKHALHEMVLYPGLGPPASRREASTKSNTFVK